MIYTITRTLGDAIAATLTRSGEFVVNPSDEERAVFTDYDAALEATVSLQVKHDLKRTARTRLIAWSHCLKLHKAAQYSVLAS
jgi:hypothetical protein